MHLPREVGSLRRLETDEGLARRRATRVAGALGCRLANKEEFWDFGARLFLLSLYLTPASHPIALLERISSPEPFP